MSIQKYLDQLDILPTYISYWVEFKDKERVREENTPKDAVKMGVGFIGSCEDFKNSIVNNRSGVNLNKVIKGNFANYVVEKQQPMPFERIISTFNKLKRPLQRSELKESPKQSVINSIKKFV